MGVTNLANRVANGDLDFDKMTNFEEYIAGTHPLDSNSVFKIEEVNGKIGVQTFVDKDYTISKSSDLISWNTHTNFQGSGNFESFEMIPNMFYKASVEVIQ